MTSHPVPPPEAAPGAGAFRYPIPSIGKGLTFTGVAGELAEAIQSPGSSAVVQAPPGTGKTTVVPPVVANAVGENPGCEAGRVVVTQPRRVAARSAARRLRQLLGEHASDVVESVAYTVRGESTLTPRTRIEFVTPGVMLRRLIRDPELDGIAAVVLDEVHERALDSDLLLTLLIDARALREDLRLLALSATLDAGRFAEYMGGAPVVDSPSALFPIDHRQAAFSGLRVDERGVSRAFLSHVASSAVGALDEPGEVADSDVLVFVPGAWEVSEAASVARGLLENGPHSSVEVCELHGRIPLGEQDRIVSGRSPGGARRIIVSTALAESSLTVPGVRIVVDSGLSREVRRDSGRRMSGLVTVTTPRSGMEQRAGRAGRLGPGLAIRCFDQRTYAGARAHTTPEITSADLTQTALTLAAWGTPEGKGLTFLDPLPPAALADAVETLAAIGAVGADGRITTLGRTLAEIPADPRLGRALIDAPALLGSDRGLVPAVVAALSLDAALPLEGRPVDSPRAPVRRQESEARRLSTLADRVPRDLRNVRGGAADGVARDAAHACGVVVALAYPDRIARRVSERVYELAGGTRAGLPEGHPVAGAWIAVAEVSRSQGKDSAGTGAVIREAAPLREADAFACAGPLVGEHEEIDFDSGGAKARRVRSLGSIEVSSTPVRVSGAAARDAVVAGIERAGLEIFSWSATARTLRARLDLLHREIGEPWPAVDSGSLLARFPEIAAVEIDALAGIGRRSPLAPKDVDMADVLRRILPWPEATRLDELAPEKIRVPSGSAIRLTYPETWDSGLGVADEGGERVRLSVKLQEMFGLDDTPRIVDGRVPVLCELLSPARRPLAVTDDLASFWDGPYFQVRSEMRGRYPKHPWPENPRDADATARTKRGNN